jgi:hypothetical protein
MGSATYQPTAPTTVRGLGDQLARFFDRLAAAPLPPHMADLVEQLEQAYAAEAAGQTFGASAVEAEV